MARNSRTCIVAVVAWLVGWGTEVAAEPGDSDTDRAGVASRLVAQAPAESASEPTCYRMAVRDGVALPVDGKQTKYPVRPGDQYVEFRFSAPWSGTRYIKSIRPLVDNGEVLERARLFRLPSTDKGRGVQRGAGAHPESEFLFGWSLPTDTLELTEPIGIAVPEGARLLLEHHYDNRTGEPGIDGSGVELCVTAQQPERLVAMAWLGSEGFKGDSVTATCTPKLTRAAQIMPISAYTRQRGVGVKAVVTRADGQTATVFDEKVNVPGAAPVRALPVPYNFEPGDKLSVTCSYNGVVNGGHPASLETCELYVLHSPAGALSRPTFMSLVHGVTTCID